jgi:hypothetical protein
MSICLNYVACLNIKKLILDLFCQKSKKSVNVEKNEKNNKTTETDENTEEQNKLNVEMNVYTNKNVRKITENEKKQMTEFISSIDNLYKTVVHEPTIY